jgi:hypothetical protein
MIAENLAPKVGPFSSRSRYQIEQRKLSDMKPNRFNAALFPDSLSQTSIEQIADDLSRNGQRVPVEVTPSGIIIDGERRWRGAWHLGWEEMDVVITEELDDDQMLDRVLDACTSSRQMSVREQVNVYVAVSEQLKREAGRERGRPAEKIMPNGIIYLTPDSIRDAASRKAGFSSAKAAIRAEAVFSRGSAELQEQVLDGSLTISAAYAALPKRPKKQQVQSDGDEPEATAGDTDRHATSPSNGDEPAPALGDSAAIETPDGGPPEEKQGAADMGSERGSVHTGDPEVNDAGSEESADPWEEESAEPFLGQPSGRRGSVNEHVNAICSHIACLSDRHYDEASALLDEIVEQMRGALGEPPEIDDDRELSDDSGCDFEPW